MINGARGESNSAAPLNLRKLLILRDATVATTARFARVGYTLGTLCLLPLLSAGVASAQSARKDDIVLGTRGPIAGASISICTQPATV